MSKESDKEILQALAAEVAKSLKAEKDLSALRREPVKLTAEAALGRELVKPAWVPFTLSSEGSDHIGTISPKKTLK